MAIVVLQVYWLYTSYIEQKARFNADIESALSATEIHMMIDKALIGSSNQFSQSQDANRVSQALGQVLSKLNLNDGGSGGNEKDTMIITMSAQRDPALLDSAPSDGVLTRSTITKSEQGLSMSPGNMEAPNRSIALAQSKELFASELNKRQIRTPFELAIKTSTNTFVASTIDSSKFERIPIKSSNETAAIPFLPNGERLQAAFPDANLYLLRRMAWTLSITFLLIIICGCSFGFMLVSFFRQKRLSDIRNDFLNNMTHELKTPISSVSLAMELMQSEQASGRSKEEYITIAQHELKRLTMLVDKILKMAAFDRAEIRLSKERFEVEAWAQEVITNMKPLLESSSAMVSLKVSPEHLHIHGDKTHLTNVLQNLIDNAIKYNESPSPSIRVEVLGNQQKTSIIVADNGKGIPGQYLSKVFDKFFRVPAGNRHDVKGYGLGLSYVKSVIDLHGGSVGVVSQEGVGSTFTIIIPQDD